MIERIAQMKIGNPLDTDTQMGALASAEQFEHVCYLEIGRQEGAGCLIGGKAQEMANEYKKDFIFSRPC